MPSRNRAYSYWERNLQDVYSNANHPELVEVVTALDGDDPQKEDYFNIGTKFPNQRILIGNTTKTGYSKCGLLWEQCASASTGKVLTLWNDDMFVQTKGWDDILFNALADKKLIGTGNTIGDAYRFCCVSVSRKIYEILGEFTFNYNGSIDRCYEALCKYYNCEINVPFTVRHIHDINFPERDAFYDYCRVNWDKKLLEWDTLGLIAANKLKNTL